MIVYHFKITFRSVVVCVMLVVWCGRSNFSVNVWTPWSNGERSSMHHRCDSLKLKPILKQSSSPSHDPNRKSCALLPHRPADCALDVELSLDSHGESIASLSILSLDAAERLKTNAGRCNRWRKERFSVTITLALILRETTEGIILYWIPSDLFSSW